MKTYQSFSSEQTKHLGETLAKDIKANKTATVFALQGDLGAGKTTFVQGFFKGLGLKKRSPSPTFIIMRRQTLKKNEKFSNIFHIDAYRLKDAKSLKELGINEVMNNPQHIVLIEWADRAKSIVPKSAHWLEFQHGKKENERKIIIKR